MNEKLSCSITGHSCVLATGGEKQGRKRTAVCALREQGN